MEDLVGRIARAAARRLVTEHGPTLPVDVELALNRADGRVDGRADRYFDPVSLGALIVSAASLGWTVYKDLRAQAAVPQRPEMTHRIQIELQPGGSSDSRDQVVEVVVDEILRAADE